MAFQKLEKVGVQIDRGDHWRDGFPGLRGSIGNEDGIGRLEVIGTRTFDPDLEKASARRRGADVQNFP
jgi:hypothetical protein